MSFEPLFHPRGVALIGASGDLSRISGQPVAAFKKAGYTGGFYPVNPKYQEIAGYKCYPDVASIDGPCDMAIVALPAPHVAKAIRDCGKAGIKFAVVLTAGFRETGAEGRAIEAELAKAAREAGVRVIGPNCQGMISLHHRVYAVFGSVSQETDFRLGDVSCAFQSGGFGYAVVNLAELQGVGFRYCVSSGNETDVTMIDLLDAFLDDPGTNLAFGYMEGTPDARRLIDLGAKSLEKKKPVLIWKGAQSSVGEKAAASHTANMTGDYTLYRAAMRQAGIIEVDDVEPIVDIARLFSQGRLPAGNRIGVLSISGGSGVVFADRAVREGLELPPFAPETVAALRAIVPAFGSIENPADTTAGIFNDISLFTKTLDIVLADPGIDQLSVLLASITGPSADKAVQAVVAAAAKTEKPVHLAWSGRRPKAEASFRLIEEARVPAITTPVRLATAAAVLARFAADRRRHLARKAPSAAEPPHGLQLPAGTVTLSEAESKAILARFGMPVTKEILVKDEADAARAGKSLAFPLAVKIVSRDIPHKTEAGGVVLGVKDQAALTAAVAQVRRNALAYKAGAKIDGVLVSEMATGIEALIGVVNDPGFGPCVVLGLGGVLAEILKDTAVRVAPFGLETAHEMIAELKAAKLFDGYRGKPAGDKAALAEALVAVSRLAMTLKDRLKEMDINPVFVRPPGQGVVAADALIVLR